ncbi:cell division ATP-binding protein FtsE [Desulfopila sp. IMCC35008]|uniref:cell division ATP-binding protein FtsE n=1 Tax=Desulfopila sp. IMCC35008 TaxID=2653858 RepID=UPI001F0E1158|nr:cell division ATP-binding protein FtsE [Desulfopila sp. IMCC35008]
MKDQLPVTERPMIEMIKVSKKYPPDVLALDNVSMSVARGELLYIIGQSGAGKTTLLKLISSMEPPTNGLIEISGIPVEKVRGNKLARLRQKIGVAYQDFKLLNDRTAAENIAISMEVSYKKPNIIDKRVRTLLDQLGLNDKHDTITGELSRGEQQRVTLARAVANSPTMVLVDEPTGNLDAITTQRVISVLKNAHKSGATVIVATHDESIYRNTSHRIIELQRGTMRLVNGGGEA